MLQKLLAFMPPPPANLSKRLSLLIGVCMFVFTSCEQAPEITPNMASSARVESIFVDDQVRQHPNFFEVRQRNGYLEFSTPSVFEEYVQKYLRASDSTLDVWEQQFEGFASQRTLHKKIMKEEKDILEKNIQNGVKNSSRSLLFNQHQHLFNYEKGHIEFKMPLQSMLKFINSDGLVRIAGHLHQYDGNTIKIIVGGDDRKIAKLKQTKQSNIEGDIVVIPITNQKPVFAGGRGEQGALSEAEDYVEMFWIYSKLSASDFLSPIYGTPVLRCDDSEELGGNRFICWWEYEIIGYELKTSASYSTRMERSYWQFGLCWTAYSGSIGRGGIFYINGVEQPSIPFSTMHNTSSVSGGFYSGTAATISASFNFTFGLLYTFGGLGSHSLSIN